MTMPTASTKPGQPSSASGTGRLTVGRVPFLNCAPFFQGLGVDGAVELVDVPPRQLGKEAEAGNVAAGPMALADYLRLQDRFERLGNLGIAVHGRCGSTELFSRRPIRQLDGAVIAVSDQTSTTALLLRLILEQRYALSPKAYQRGAAHGAADAALLIGDDALKFRAENRTFPFEIDLSFEWWLWQHLPSVFAVWVVRKDCSPDDKQRLSRTIQKQLAVNLGRLDLLAQQGSERLGLSSEELKLYLTRFQYRLSEPEERAIKQFEQLVHEHHLL